MSLSVRSRVGVWSPPIPSPTAPPLVSNLRRVIPFTYFDGAGIGLGSGLGVGAGKVGFGGSGFCSGGNGFGSSPFAPTILPLSPPVFSPNDRLTANIARIVNTIAKSFFMRSPLDSILLGPNRYDDFRLQNGNVSHWDSDEILNIVSSIT